MKREREEFCGPTINKQIKVQEWKDWYYRKLRSREARDDSKCGWRM